MKGSNTMATASNTHTKPRGSWSAANASRPKGSPRKWTFEMQEQLVDEVREADRRGTARQAVYDRLAGEWSKAHRDELYTPHQVSSQFHLAKARFGYDVVKQAQGDAKRVRKVSKPPTRTKGKVVLAPAEPLVDASGIVKTVGAFIVEAIQAVNEALVEANERAEAAERERDEAQAALRKVQDALR